MTQGNSKPLLSSRFDDALQFASESHRDQVRKGTRIPYVAHLLSVAGLALEAGADEDTAIAALLHDAIEDQGGAEMEAVILSRFGKRVADIVVECSDADTVPKPPWCERKKAYVQSIPGKSAEACLVSLSDKIHNARAILVDYNRIGDELWSRFSGGRKGTLWYYRALSDAFRSRGPEPLWRILEDTVCEIERKVGVRS